MKKKNILIISWAKEEDIKKIVGGVEKYINVMIDSLSQFYNIEYRSMQYIMQTLSKKEILNSGKRGMFKNIKYLDKYDVIINNTREYLDLCHNYKTIMVLHNNWKLYSKSFKLLHRRWLTPKQWVGGISASK